MMTDRYSNSGTVPQVRLGYSSRDVVIDNNTSRLFPSEDAASAVDCLLALTPEDIARFGAAERTQLQALYSIERMAERTLKVYRSVV